jgi:hypothetical protein
MFVPKELPVLLLDYKYKVLSRYKDDDLPNLTVPYDFRPPIAGSFSSNTASVGRFRQKNK